MGPLGVVSQERGGGALTLWGGSGVGAGAPCVKGLDLLLLAVGAGR